MYTKLKSFAHLFDRKCLNNAPLRFNLALFFTLISDCISLINAFVIVLPGNNDNKVSDKTWNIASHYDVIAADYLSLIYVGLVLLNGNWITEKLNYKFALTVLKKDWDQQSNSTSVVKYYIYFDYKDSSTYNIHALKLTQIFE